MRRITIKQIFISMTMLLFAATDLAMAKKDKDEDNGTVIPYKFYTSIVPVIGANPTYGTLYGVAVGSGVTLGNPDTTKMTTISANAIQTSNDQTMFLIKSVGYTANNEWMFIEDGRLFLSSQETFGLGTDKTRDGRKQSSLEAEDGDLMDFNLYRFHLTGLKQIKPSLYLGLGYSYDQYAKIKDVNLDLENGDTTAYYDYTKKHGFRLNKAITSGVSLNMIYDTRDNIATPYTGMYAFGAFTYYPEFLGSDKDASTIWLEARDYISLDENNPRKLLALWGYYSAVTSGDLPYLDLPAVGWDQFGRSGRGYTQGRFRGNSIFYSEAELRMPLNISKNNPDRYGYTLFANMTSASDDDRDIEIFDGVEIGAGVGFRYLMNEKTRSYLAVDLAMDENKNTSFYLNINESF